MPAFAQEVLQLHHRFDLLHPVHMHNDRVMLQKHFPPDLIPGLHACCSLSHWRSLKQTANATLRTVKQVCQGCTRRQLVKLRQENPTKPSSQRRCMQTAFPLLDV